MSKKTRISNNCKTKCVPPTPVDDEVLLPSDMLMRSTDLDCHLSVFWQYFGVIHTAKTPIYFHSSFSVKNVFEI